VRDLSGAGLHSRRMEMTRDQSRRLFLAVVPEIERDIERLKEYVEATRGCNVLGPDYADRLGIRERALASIVRDYDPVG